MINDHVLIIREIRVDEKRSSELLERLHWPLSKSLEEDPDIPVIKEMLVLLYMNPKIHFIYDGRVGKVNSSRIPWHRVKKNSDFLFIDRPLGRRFYKWLIREEYEEECRNLEKAFQNFVDWCKDEDSEIILSIGSGGLKIYSFVALLKIIDLLELRDNINEIWGSSMGAVLSYLYGIGLDMKR